MTSTIKPRVQTVYSPLRVNPSFVFPVFSIDDSPYLQSIGEDERIAAFVRLRNFKLQNSINIKQHISRDIGDPAIYAFLFNSNDLVIGSRNEVARILDRRIAELKNQQNTLLDVFNFLSDDQRKVEPVRKIMNSLHDDDKDIGLYENVDHDQLMFQLESALNVKDGHINYWHLFSELDNIIENWGQVYAKIKLLRSRIGTSPKQKNALRSFGLATRRINYITPLIPINSGAMSQLKQVAEKVMIVEVRIFAANTVTIRAIDPKAIQKRYFKKNVKKNVKTKNHKDYKFEISNVSSN